MKKKAFVIDKCHNCPNCKSMMLAMPEERPALVTVCIDAGEHYEIIEEPYSNPIPDWCPLPDCGGLLGLCPKCGVATKLKMVRPPIKGARKRFPMKVCPICHLAISAEK